MYFFVHTDEIRSSFDTYRKILRLSNDGFKEEHLQIRNADKIGIIMDEDKS